MSTIETDPYGAHRFRVSCDALPSLGFVAVRGLSTSVVADADEQSPVGRRGERRTRRCWRGLPARVTHDVSPRRRRTRSPTLTLRRGVTDDDSLWRWLTDWVSGTVDPQDVRICLLDARGRPARGWVCREATPVRWRGPDLVATEPAVAMETLAVSHEGIDAITDLDDCDDGSTDTDGPA